MASFEINKNTGQLAAFAAAGLDAPAAPAPQPGAPTATPPAKPAENDRNLATGGLGVLRNAAGLPDGGLTAFQGTDLAGSGGSTGGGAPSALGGGPQVYSGGDLTASPEYKLYEAEVAQQRAQQSLDAATQAAKAELAKLMLLTNALPFAQGGEVDALAPEQRKKTFDQYLSRAQAALATTPPNAEHYRSHLSSALAVLSPTSDAQKRYYGPPVPGSADAAAQLRTLIKGSGYKGDALTNPGSLYALRGNLIEARSVVDTLKNAAAQAQKIQLKTAEAAAAQAEAATLRDRYQAVRTENLTAVAAFESGMRGQITSLLAANAHDPELVKILQEALKLLAGAADAFRVSEYGHSKQFLDKLKQALKVVPGVDLSAFEAMGKRVAQTQQAASQSWLATHKASRLAQEAERMRAGYEKALR